MPLSTHIIKADNIPDAWFQLIYDIFDDERALADIRRVDKGSFEGTLRREYKSILFEIANPCDPDLSKRIVRIPESKLGIPNPIDPIIYPEFKCPKCGERVTSFKPEQELYQIKPCDHYVSKEDYELNKPTMESAVVKYYGDYLFGSSLSKNEQYTYGSRIMESIRIDYDTRNPIVRELLNRFKKNIVISPSKIFVDVPQYYYLCAYILTNPQSNQIVMQIAMPSDLSLPDSPCLRGADIRVRDGKIHWFINYRCLVGDTPVFAKVDDIILRSNMENLYEQHLNGSNIQVMSVDDKFEPMWGDVTNIQRQIKNDIIRIELFGGGGLSVTEDHRIFVLRGELKLLMEARDIEPGDFLLEPRSFSNVVEYTSDYIDLFQLFKDRGNVYVKDLTLDDFAIFKRNGVEYTENFRDKRYISVSSVQDSHLKELNNLTLGCQKQIFPRMYQLSEDFLYFMGLWLADGWYNSKGNALRLAISNKKDYNLNRVLKFLEEEFQYCPNTEDRDGCKVLNIAIKFLAMLFQDLGFVHGSKVKFVPNFVYTLDFVKLQIFLDGWLSGDGGTTTSKDMIVDFSYIMKRLGKNYSIYTEKSRRVFFRSENRIIESSGCHHIMEFGKDKSKRVENQHFYKKKVKSVGIISKEDFVYDLSVDTPSHLFFAGEVPVLVHNSWDMYSGMPLNLAGLSMLMDQMCVDTDLEPGSFICHSKGLHIYEHSWSSALARLGR